MNANQKGFTLIEILIVVVIMAVLAAVVVPQFTGSTDDAKKSTADFNLGAVRAIVQTFRAQHAGAIPALDATNKSIPGLISKTDASGAVSATGAFGPYLSEIPINPFTGKSDVKAAPAVPPTSANVTASNAGGWMYDAATGQLWLDSNVTGEFGW